MASWDTVRLVRLQGLTSLRVFKTQILTSEARVPEKKITSAVSRYALSAPREQGLARAILADSSGGFGARGIIEVTRSPTMPRCLTELEGSSEIESIGRTSTMSRALTAAFSGCHARSSASRNFWEHFSPDQGN